MAANGGKAPKKSALKSPSSIVTVAAKKQPPSPAAAPAKSSLKSASSKPKAAVAPVPAKAVSSKKKPAAAARSSVPPPRAAVAPVADDDIDDNFEEETKEAAADTDGGIEEDGGNGEEEGDAADDNAPDDFIDDAPAAAAAAPAVAGEEEEDDGAVTNNNDADAVDAITENDDESTNGTATAATPPVPVAAPAKKPTKKRIRTVITETTTTTTTTTVEAKKTPPMKDTTITITPATTASTPGAVTATTNGNGAAPKITSVYGRVKKKLMRIERGEWVPDRDAPNQQAPSLGGKWLSDWTRVKVKSNQVLPYEGGHTGGAHGPMVTGTAADRYGVVEGDMAHMAPLDNNERVDDPSFPPWALWTSIGADGQHPKAMDSLSTSLLMIANLMAFIVVFCVVVWAATYGLWRFLLDPIGDLPLAVWVQRTATEEPTWPEVVFTTFVHACTMQMAHFNSWYMFPGPASAVLRHPFKSIVSPVWTISLCILGNVLVFYMGFYTEGFYGPLLYRTFYLALLYGAVLFSVCMMGADESVDPNLPSGTCGCNPRKLQAFLALLFLQLFGPFCYYLIFGPGLGLFQPEPLVPIRIVGAGVIMPIFTGGMLMGGRLLFHRLSEVAPQNIWVVGYALSLTSELACRLLILSGKDEGDDSNFYWVLLASVGLSLISFLGRITVVLRESWSVGLAAGTCRGPPSEGLSLRFPPGLPLPNLRRRLRAAADFIHVDIFSSMLAIFIVHIIQWCLRIAFMNAPDSDVFTALVHVIPSFIFALGVEIIGATLAIMFAESYLGIAVTKSHKEGMARRVYLILYLAFVFAINGWPSVLPGVGPFVFGQSKWNEYLFNKTCEVEPSTLGCVT